MDTKARLKAHTVPEPVTFWKWINNVTIGIVTATYVFHWVLDGNSSFFSFFLAFTKALLFSTHRY